MNQLLGKARPGMQMNDIMNELGFKPETPERQRFFDDLRSFHQDPRHPHRLSLKTTVNASLVDEEFLNFMRRFGDDYFGPQYRSHLKPTARIFIRGTSDVWYGRGIYHSFELNKLMSVQYIQGLHGGAKGIADTLQKS